MKKKNRTWRAAALLLALTLVTSCFVGGTFAKYTTTGEATDTARVAKFGVTVEASGSLFDKTYVNADSGNTPGSGTLTVNSSGGDGDNVLAPGTQSSAEGLTFSVTGNPEVNVTVTSELKARNIYLKAGTYAKMVKVVADSGNFTNYYILKDSKFEKVTADASFDSNGAYYELKEIGKIDADYFPVQYKLAGDTTSTASVEKDSLTDNTAGAEGAAQKIATQLGLANVDTDTDGVTKKYTGTGKTVSANANLSTLNLGNETLTWEWEFEKGVTGSTTGEKYDKQDTLLGDMMAYNTADGATNDYEIVAVTGTVGSETYTKLIFDGDNKLVKNGSDIVASLKTEFNLSITVTQVD